MQTQWPFRAAPRPILAREAAFHAALMQGYGALDAGDAPTAYAAFERAHVLGQPRTATHVRSHVAFLHWAIRRRDAREIVGQLLRIAAAALFTWLWMPRGNTGGARVSAFRRMPIPTDLTKLTEGNPR